MNNSGITKQKLWSQVIVPATDARLTALPRAVITEFVGLNSVCLQLNEVPPWYTLMMVHQK